MENKITPEEVFSQLDRMFPQAHCELDYGTVFQLAVSVILSAQTTDVSVNKVTPALFEKYPDAKAMAEADVKDVENIIHSIGLYRNKASNIVKMAQELNKRFGGVVPDNMDELTSLPGIGRKTANVILSEGYKIPAIAVDTHVHRVSWRLGFSEKNDTPEQVEARLKKLFPEEQWSLLHHLLIFFGRYCCNARNPQCSKCPFEGRCYNQ